MFVLELHADFQLYFRRFFGFFTRDSGWGSVTGPKFRLLPAEIYEPRAGLLLLMAGLMLAALYRLRRERAQFVVWLLVLPLGWVVYCYAYYKNQGGGGPALLLRLLHHGVVPRRSWAAPRRPLAAVGAGRRRRPVHLVLIRGSRSSREAAISSRSASSRGPS